MSLGNDLSAIRKEKNLTLEDIFEVTKIPVHTLKSIENDTLLSSSSESKTYLRSFVRSYAKALKISDVHILAALESTEAGIYDNDLIKLRNPDSASEEYSLKKDKVEVDTPKTIDPDSLKADTYQEEIEASANTENDIVPENKPAGSSSSNKPTVDSINWADMSKKVYASPANSKIGLVLILVLIVGGLATAGYFYGGNILGLFSSDETTNSVPADDTPDTTQQDITAITSDSSATATQLPETNTPTETITTLPETLTVVLYAAYDKLEPVRVTSDFNNRTNPFWMDQGEAYYFDFQDSLQIRGQYSRFLLMYNGNVINNPRQSHFDPDLDAIVLTREILSNPEYEENTQNSFPPNLGVAAPDSIVYRIRF
jgi:transcriptional regulator with XRE-family HTH domain